MKILYVLPRPDFFSWGPCGRVAHALGVIAGLEMAGAELIVTSGSGLRNSVVSASVECIECQPLAGPAARHRWVQKLVAHIDKLLEMDGSIEAVLVRYAVSNAPLFASLMRRHPHCSWCFEVNSLGYHHLTVLPRPIRNSIASAEIRSLSAADLLYVVSAALMKDLTRIRPELEPRIAIVPNGGPDLAEPLVKNGISGNDAEGHVRFMYLGVLQPYYEYEIVVEGFKRLRASGIGATLHFHGYGANYERLARMIATVQGASLHGRYDLSDLISNGTIDSNCVLLVPCRAGGSSLIVSPIKLFEYMSMGLPIIASSAGQAAEILRQGETGFIYRAGDAESCAGVMRTAASDPASRRRIASAAWAEYREYHTWSARMRQLLGAMTSLAG